MPSLCDDEGHDALLELPPGQLSRAWRTCPLCGSPRLKYLFRKGELRVERCDECRLLLLNPPPNAAQSAPVDETREATSVGPDGDANPGRSDAIRAWLREIGRYRPGHGCTLLAVGDHARVIAGEARALGYDANELAGTAWTRDFVRPENGPEAIHVPRELAALKPGSHRYDVCILSHVIERVGDPAAFLSLIHTLLRPDGVLLMTTPALDSWPARVRRENWSEFKTEHLFYFDRNTIQHALFAASFRQVIVRPGEERLSLETIATSFERLARPDASGTANHRRNSAGSMLVLARSKPLATRLKLSVVLPAYNEVDTFETVLCGLLHKELPELDLEIVIVESNSTDGTRAVALKYQDHPRVRLVLQDRPRGKGHAVRAGLQRATGDFVLIQDADLEYDLEDYGILLDPLITHREAFVLGARHGGNAWKMRQFAGQWPLATALNCGHWIFAGLVNVLFGLRLKDPFTMYKVFRRDCLYGLSFECDRFDFDYELLIKLVRKGYAPIEIPINYRSRSFQEGKKVSVWRDPFTWLWALVRLRVTPVDPLRTIEHERRQAPGEPHP